MITTLSLLLALVLVGTLLVPNAAEVVMLNNVLNKVAPQDQTLILYTNNVTPAETDTEATYTEAAGFGYASVALTGASWTVTGGSPTEAVAAEQTWTFTGALGNVYGYEVKQTTSGKVLWAERFSTGPFNIANNGDQIKVTPKFTGE